MSEIELIDNLIYAQGHSCEQVEVNVVLFQNCKSYKTKIK